jgi:hypothetical protein
MTPKPTDIGTDPSLMTLNFLPRRRLTAECAHERQMRIEVAGMSREVCESCGRVSVAYVGDHFQRDDVAAVSGSDDSSD